MHRARHSHDLGGSRVMWSRTPHAAHRDRVGGRRVVDAWSLRRRLTTHAHAPVLRRTGSAILGGLLPCEHIALSM
jgi:hypothetical protein